VRTRLLLTLAATAYLVTVGVAQRRDVFVASRDHAAIAYTATAPTDAIARLNERLAAGTATLEFQPDSGYLRSVLGALGVPVESQTVVFSQTSFQAPLIDMRNPRAVYFNDTVSVGWVRGGTLLELTAQDPRQGVIFYSLEQKPGSAPRFVRDNMCLACHLSWDTLGVPGLLMMSTLPRPDENAYANGFVTNHNSLFNERWSGWYVTGNPGARHLGNIPVTPAELKKTTVADPRLPLKSLEGVFDLKGFPTAHSDVVPLMVLAHQTHMTNLITRLGWEARLGDPERVNDAVAQVVDYMLFVDEPPLAAKVEGHSGFTEMFSAIGPRDAQGRSLRQLDLQQRLLRYPCSYMIYSEAFDALPATARDAVYAGLWRVLSGQERAPKYARLAAADRQAIVDILRATKKDLPDTFGS
jgi:hypothetical protein